MSVTLRIEGARKTWSRGRVQALRGVSLDVAAGSVIGLVGPNGAGKSTLMGATLGFVRLDAGSVSILGSPASSRSAKRATGWLPQAFAVEPGLTGRQMLTWLDRVACGDQATRARRVEAALESVGLTAADAGRRMTDYSGGLRQRVGVAQAFMRNPALIVLDEPTVGLDPLAVGSVRDLIAAAKRRNACVLLSSHQLDEVDRTCDDIVFLSQGRIIEDLGARLAARHRELRVRLLASAPRPDEAALTQLAASVGARFLSLGAEDARFEVAGDEEAARLIHVLALSGLACTEVAATRRPLEALFGAEAVRARG